MLREMILKSKEIEDFQMPKYLMTNTDDNYPLHLQKTQVRHWKSNMEMHFTTFAEDTSTTPDDTDPLKEMESLQKKRKQQMAMAKRQLAELQNQLEAARDALKKAKVVQEEQSTKQRRADAWESRGAREGTMVYHEAVNTNRNEYQDITWGI